MAALHRFCRVAAGGAHGLIVTERAEVLAWGSNSHGQVGNDSAEERPRLDDQTFTHMFCRIVRQQTPVYFNIIWDTTGYNFQLHGIVAARVVNMVRHVHFIISDIFLDTGTHKNIHVHNAVFHVIAFGCNFRFAKHYATRFTFLPA